MSKFWSDERGTETVEWGVMAGLIVAGLVTVVAAIGTWIYNKLNGMKTDLGA